MAFAISFIVVVSFWRANHQQVTRFAALDNPVVVLNCLVMFGIVLIPFATEALGKLTLPLPVAVYAMVYPRRASCSSSYWSSRIDGG